MTTLDKARRLEWQGKILLGWNAVMYVLTAAQGLWGWSVMNATMALVILYTLDKLRGLIARLS